MVDLYLVNGRVRDEEFSTLASSGEIFDYLRNYKEDDVDLVIWKINGYSEALSEMSVVEKDGKIYLCGDGVKIGG